MRCLLGDFSSAWDDYTGRNLYSRGPSAREQTDEYAPVSLALLPSNFLVPLFAG